MSDSALDLHHLSTSTLIDTYFPSSLRVICLSNSRSSLLRGCEVHYIKVGLLRSLRPFTHVHEPPFKFLSKYAQDLNCCLVPVQQQGGPKAKHVSWAMSSGRMADLRWDVALQHRRLLSKLRLVHPRPLRGG